MALVFANRKSAGVTLAERVRRLVPPRHNAVVLAVPRGGVTVGAPVAAALNAELDVLSGSIAARLRHGSVHAPALLTDDAKQREH